MVVEVEEKEVLKVLMGVVVVVITRPQLLDVVVLLDVLVGIATEEHGMVDVVKQPATGVGVVVKDV
jgi:hypothetical protein